MNEIDDRGASDRARARTRTRLTDGASVERDAGVLACLDGYMNIAMEQTEVRERSGDAREAAKTRRPGRRRTDGGRRRAMVGIRQRTVEE